MMPLFTLMPLLPRADIYGATWRYAITLILLDDAIRCYCCLRDDAATPLRRRFADAIRFHAIVLHVAATSV